MLDDYNLAYNTFFKEWNDVRKILDIRKYQVLAAGRTWSESTAMVKMLTRHIFASQIAIQKNNETYLLDIAHFLI